MEGELLWRQESPKSRGTGKVRAFHRHLSAPISGALPWTTPKCELAAEDPYSMHFMRALCNTVMFQLWVLQEDGDI